MKNTTTRAPRWTFRGFFWKSYEYEIESPTAAEDIAALNEQIQEKYRLIRLNNKMDSIIKAEQERRERSVNND